MIRLTVLYNLSKDTAEDEFLKWRLTEHQSSNLAIEGVVRTDFASIDSAWPTDAKPKYRFMTTVDWPDRESFQKGFYAPDVQADMKKNMDMLSNPIYLISEILIEERK
ncbi:MAG: hypothetical protein ABSG01_15880 [Anaerolineales bacterium]|jgi:hypothetical protein